MLGDGRALLLGEIVDRHGRRRDLHRKGSGRTPFARGGDGKAALGPMLREYVIGEAMHALGVPTTRALAVVTTGEPVARETVLPGAVLARVAASHLRVGTFQYAAATGDVALVRRLADPDQDPARGRTLAARPDALRTAFDDDTVDVPVAPIARPPHAVTTWVVRGRMMGSFVGPESSGDLMARLLGLDLRRARAHP